MDLGNGDNDAAVCCTGSRLRNPVLADFPGSADAVCGPRALAGGSDRPPQPRPPRACPTPAKGGLPFRMKRCRARRRR
ncbi:MAG: hypothetical protein AW08_02539 [Candidatus Accumulibacter adjunctus]|uniref:Uncharacterized protein n=1 Tax=Candidatus Accumulibacter adjunctus TaxID=1454001 RepID=A0A011NPP1_9PROT|nr:MAG: hypothetical protein AW08_02539 [Candidatus Accumulibacter adjunctus]